MDKEVALSYQTPPSKRKPRPAASSANLLHEAGMYRWGEAEDRRAKVPVNKDNHALAALRYLIATIDRHSFSKRLGKSAPPTE
jgi:hypothetical protein